ncbi:DUF1311 domain-containing protein [Mucilaginibacter sp. Bleaf8]|uniref:lysozyme inhibitor LprI family protein n=1 Tax=Mucilaginibacter sp. Bleaf8 TaxID=2834430 RepID=UPI001BCAEBA8|nr:lysozyme inhibitor LprI family protein [Mucilaginibacter sp. Bleaf8]MBS7564127.1 DUF1311 domain-containing protein [Mucilaginibacter sp. Bleaf8]
MKNILGTLTVVVLLLSMHICAHAQTQTSMNATAATGYQQADKELNTVYQKILKQYAKQPVFIKKLKTAQRLWVQLRDAELAAKYPSPGAYGSAEPMCKATYLESLTRERTKFLRVWLDGIEEGDVCSGSVKMK